MSQALLPWNAETALQPSTMNILKQFYQWVQKNMPQQQKHPYRTNARFFDTRNKLKGSVDVLDPSTQTSSSQEGVTVTWDKYSAHALATATMMYFASQPPKILIFTIVQPEFMWFPRFQPDSLEPAPNPWTDQLLFSSFATNNSSATNDSFTSPSSSETLTTPTGPLYASFWSYHSDPHLRPRTMYASRRLCMCGCDHLRDSNSWEDPIRFSENQYRYPMALLENLISSFRDSPNLQEQNNEDETVEVERESKHRHVADKF